MEEEQPENDRMIEAMTVIDLDPSFAIFRPTGIFRPIPARVEMGVQS